MTATLQSALRRHMATNYKVALDDQSISDIEHLFRLHGYRAPGDYSIPGPPPIPLNARWECGNIECNWSGMMPRDYSGIRCCPRCDHVCQVV